MVSGVWDLKGFLISRAKIDHGGKNRLKAQGKHSEAARALGC